MTLTIFYLSQHSCWKILTLIVWHHCGEQKKYILMSRKIKSIRKNTLITHQYFKNIFFCVIFGNDWRKRSHEVNWSPLSKSIFPFWSCRITKIVRINWCAQTYDKQLLMYTKNYYFLIWKMVTHPDFLSTTLCIINNQNHWTLPELGANFHGKTFKLVDFCSLFFPP